MQTNDAIALWKELGITRGNMEFSCGGDSMSDYNFEFFNGDNDTIDSSELNDYFDTEVFNRVEFYVNSDGHYIGEVGNVEIILNDDEDDFEYNKDAQSEFNETFTDTFTFKLTKEQYDFIKDKVENLNGESSWTKNINYKEDCIVTDTEEEMVNKLLQEIGDTAEDCEIENSEGEPQDETTWTSGDELILTNEDGVFSITIEVSRSYYVYVPSED